MLRALFYGFLALCVLAIAGSTFAFLEGKRRFTSPGPLAEQKLVLIPKGSGLEGVAKRLMDAGAIPDPYSFVAGVKWHKAALKAGEYVIAPHASAQEIMNQMAEGRTLIRKLTIPEGLTTRHILALIQETDFLAGQITQRPAEGALLPETWHVQRDDSRADLVTRMERQMTAALDQAWVNRKPGLPLKTPSEALILASVVERETGLAAERPQVAAVFINRLRLGMKLQSDPTVIYGLSDGWGTISRGLSRADLENPHPWNTYVHPGLPLTPIANPGKASIEAVLHPADSDALYFVADGTGGHAFAKSLDQHNRNVAKWREIEKGR